MAPRTAGPGLGIGVDELVRLDAATGMARPAGPTVTPSATVTGGAAVAIDVLLLPAAHARSRPRPERDVEPEDPESADQHRGDDGRADAPDHQAWNTALKPGFIISDRRSTSQLVMRMQPWLSARPMVSGSPVPWMP